MTRKRNWKEYQYEESLIEARRELAMAQDETEYIYRLRQIEAWESDLISHFYYSVYHCVKGISILDSGLNYGTHYALESYFNNRTKDDHWCPFHDTNIIDAEFRNGIVRLRSMRKEYDYREQYVDEDDYVEAESIWKSVYPVLENLLIQWLGWKEQHEGEV